MKTKINVLLRAYLGDRDQLPYITRERTKAMKTKTNVKAGDTSGSGRGKAKF